MTYPIGTPIGTRSLEGATNQVVGVPPHSWFQQGTLHRKDSALFVGGTLRHRRDGIFVSVAVKHKTP